MFADDLDGRHVDQWRYVGHLAKAARHVVRDCRAIRARIYTCRMDPSLPWPLLREEDRWALDAFEEQLETTTDSPEQLRQRAAELRAEADQTAIRGHQQAALFMAEKYEHAAAARAAAA